MEAESTSGSTSIGDFTDATVSSASGGVQAHSDQQVESLTVETTSGSVTLQVPDQPYEISNSSSFGNFRIDVGTSPGATARISIDTSSGSVQLTRP
ncbi:hypothetical protein GCM10007147_10540 [Nocardiopsis kunsanensis]|uniref:DUF4097 domain-containing protein n=1 Tax=Nocardiopsis kunsanensis TaxID=141693 RepID=A0A918X9F2_9ACTN|nr:hypothetical protein GCM10007147_10540 [Nocardiopsis kunsanensis]